MTRRPSPAESARLLRQRLEMGATDLVLDGMTRDEALALIAEARRAGGAGVPSAGGPRTEVPSADGPGTEVPSADGPGTGPSPAEAPRAGASPAEGPRGEASPTEAPPAQAPRAEAYRGARSEGRRPRTAAAEAPPAPSRALPVLPDDYEALRELALGCTACGLSESRTQVVFSDGPRDASLMVVGEAPGANEDETGLPFVGAAGKYLDLLLATVDLSREDSVYIANVLKCRPPGNRNPSDLEIETCSPYLRKQIDLVAPSALLAVGTFSGKLLTGQARATLGSLRGTVHSYHGVPLVVTYHPAALLRNPRWTRHLWDDLQLLRDVIDAA